MVIIITSITHMIDVMVMIIIIIIIVVHVSLTLFFRMAGWWV